MTRTATPSDRQTLTAWLALSRRHDRAVAEVRAVEIDRRRLKPKLLDMLHMRGLSDDAVTREVLALLSELPAGEVVAISKARTA